MKVEEKVAYLFGVLYLILTILFGMFGDTVGMGICFVISNIWCATICVIGATGGD